MILSSLFRRGTPLLLQKNTTRPFFEWLNIMFNQVDHSRITKFGPDRVCAEWLLRNGAAVYWVGAKEYLRDYNTLPLEGTQSFFIQKVDASGSSISHHGFLHFRDCTKIREVILHDCGYIENKALKHLDFLKNSLEHLQVSSCGNITGEGLSHLQILSNLKTLELFNLTYVKDKPRIIKELQRYLPKCKINSDFLEEEEVKN